MYDIKWLKKFIGKGLKLHHRLNMFATLFFLFPIIGLSFLLNGLDGMNAAIIWIYCFMTFLIYYAGIGLFREIGNEVRILREELARKSEQYATVQARLKKRESDIQTIEEFSEQSYVTSDPEEIFHVALERALDVTDSQNGSILMLEQPYRKSFVIKASIGLKDHVKIGDRIDFETSVAKYAVINRAPLVVEDIEKDSRFGRANRDHYGTKSFICMPIKTIAQVVGVLTVSRKDGDKPFGDDDAGVLSPLVNTAAFISQNLVLTNENDNYSISFNMINKIFGIINSSYKGTELFQAVFNEIREIVPFETASVMLREENRPGVVKVIEIIARTPTSIVKDSLHNFRGSLVEKAMNQENPLIIDEIDELTNDIDRMLLEKNLGCYIAPIRIRGEIKGVFCLTSDWPDKFYEATDLMRWAVNGLSLAIEKNRLTESITRRKQELDSIKRIGSALASSTFDIGEVLKRAMDMIRMTFNVEAGSLFLLKDNELEFTVSFNNKTIVPLNKFKIKIGQGIVGYSAATGESIIVNDTETSPQFYPEIDKDTGFTTSSVLCVPMISQGKVIGAVEVINKINGDFDSGDENLLQSIASSISIAIENARLYQETVTMAVHERNMRRTFQKFVPKVVLDKIIKKYEIGLKDAAIDELKKLTLLNIDIRGFSQIAKKIGPRKTVSMLNSFFSVMGGIVFKHFGIVDKYLGDGFLAIFGLSDASTMDAADNAVSAALEMKQSLLALNEYFEEELGAAIRIGISVHTGDVVIGNIGFDKKMDYTVIGDSVNAVFRLQDLTKKNPNSILISEITHRAAQSTLQTREIPARCDIDDALGELRILEVVGQNPNKLVWNFDETRRIAIN